MPLESIIDFSTRPLLTPAQQLAASARCNRLIDHFDVSPDARASRDYDRMKLVRLTHEYAITPDSQGNFLRAFFEAAGLQIDEDEDPDLADPHTETKLRDSIVEFADYLFNNFFLPLKASTKKTPQPSPASHSAIQRAQSDQAQPFLGTPEHVSTLRAPCLLRDRHRCVISRQFDETEALRRIVKARRQDSIPQDCRGIYVGQWAFYLEFVESRLDDFESAVNYFFQFLQSFAWLSWYYGLVGCKIGETLCLVGYLCGILQGV